MLYFNKKTLFIFAFSIYSLMCQDVGPSTPPRPNLRSFSSTTPSPIQSEVLPCYETGISPLIARTNIQSPRRRPHSEIEWSSDDDENTYDLQQNLSFGPGEFSPLKKQKRTSHTDISSMDGSTLKNYYLDDEELQKGNEKDPTQCFNLDEFGDPEIKKLELIKARANELGECSFMSLPLISFQHIEEASRDGGYHKENQDNPVETIMQNRETHIYGGFFGRTRSSGNEKFSSFFPRDMGMSDIVQLIKQAYFNPVARKNNRILGASSAGLIEITMKKSLTSNPSVTATSAYPIVAYFDTTKNDTTYDQLETSASPLSREKIIALAAQKSCIPVYELGDAKIIDIAPALLGKGNARSIYAKIAQ